MVYRLLTNGSRRLFWFEFLHRYSANAAAPPLQNHFLLDYLIKSLGLSKDEALTATRKVPPRKFSRNDPDLVVNFLQNLGLNKTQVRTIVSAKPKILTSNVEKTLQPKIQALQDLGMSRSDLIGFLVGYKSFLTRCLNSEIRPSIEYLRNLLGSDENTARVLTKCGTLLHTNAPKLITANVALLQKTGLSAEAISRLILDKPLKFLRNPERLEKILYKLENDIGFPRDSKMFYHGIVILSTLRNSAVDKKFGTFRSFGWSDATIYEVFRKCPYVLCNSEDKVRKVWNFFTLELGYKPDYLTTYPSFFNLNLEKRVRPRRDILKILTEKKLLKREVSLGSVLNIPDTKFVNKFLLPYKDKIPDVFDCYLNLRREEKVVV